MWSRATAPKSTMRRLSANSEIRSASTQQRRCAPVMVSSPHRRAIRRCPAGSADRCSASFSEKTPKTRNTETSCTALAVSPFHRRPPRQGSLGTGRAQLPTVRPAGNGARYPPRSCQSAGRSSGGARRLCRLARHRRPPARPCRALRLRPANADVDAPPRRRSDRLLTASGAPFFKQQTPYRSIGTPTRLPHSVHEPS